MYYLETVAMKINGSIHIRRSFTYIKIVVSFYKFNYEHFVKLKLISEIVHFRFMSF